MSQGVLPRDASLSDRWLALSKNVQEMYARCAAARACSSAQIGEYVFVTPEHAVISSNDVLRDEGRIDQMVNWYRECQAGWSPIIWHINEIPPQLEMSAKLLARGVSTNWKAHWMWCDLTQINHDPGLVDPAVDIHVAAADEVVTQLSEDSPPLQQLAQVAPGMIWNVTAVLGERRIGGCIVNLTDGSHGVAGLFDMAVVEDHQRQGIGSAMLAVSIQLAKEKGYNHFCLNSTGAGESVYAKAGFQSMARTTTWHIKRGFRETTPPSETVVRFLEALGQGQTERLDELAAKLTLRDMQERTMNTMTPLELAVHLDQPDSARWLVDHGVIPDIISLWKLGWKAKVAQLVVDHPTEVNRKGGDCNETPLHAAVALDDVELAQLLLGASNIDLSITDDVYNSTPMGWAEALDSERVISLLQERVGRGSSNK